MLTTELCGVIADTRARWAARPGFSAADETDLIQTMLREIIDDRPPGGYAAYQAACIAGDYQAARLTDYNAACNASVYLAVMLTDHNDCSLYARYMRVFDRINGTDFVGEFDLDVDYDDEPTSYDEPTSDEDLLTQEFLALMGDSS